MSKELNPRAWSIDGECWCTRIDYDGHKKEWSGVTPVLDPENRSKRLGEIDDNNIIVEFPTGLKDKNGREIYGGDIVVNTYYDDGEMYKVLWVDDSVAFGMESLDDMELYKLPLESLEVIGNIHENPELLEEKE